MKSILKNSFSQMSSDQKRDLNKICVIKASYNKQPNDPNNFSKYLIETKSPNKSKKAKINALSCLQPSELQDVFYIVYLMSNPVHENLTQ